jgi:hypothetical protein
MMMVVVVEDKDGVAAAEEVKDMTAAVEDNDDGCSGG